LYEQSLQELFEIHEGQQERTKKIMKDDSGLGVMMFCACTGQFVFYVIVLL